MPVFKNFTLYKEQDAVVGVAIEPATPIGGWSLRFRVKTHSDSTSGVIEKFVSSGLNNLSGINVTDSGQGTIAVDITSADTSGLKPRTYFYELRRTDSGEESPLTKGQLLLREC